MKTSTGQGREHEEKARERIELHSAWKEIALHLPDQEEKPKEQHADPAKDRNRVRDDEARRLAGDACEQIAFRFTNRSLESLTWPQDDFKATRRT